MVKFSVLGPLAGLLVVLGSQGFMLTNKVPKAFELTMHYSYPKDNPNYLNAPGVKIAALFPGSTAEIDVNYLDEAVLEEAR